MSATYYVTHPNFSLSGLVTAPSTDKARTTFLDWLERNEHIERADRQYWRRDMIASRAEDPVSLSADVVLHYGYEDAGDFVAPTPSVPVAAPRRMYGRDEEVPASRLDEDWWAGAQVESVEELDEVDKPKVAPVPEQPARQLSPIQRVALGQ